MTRLVNVLLVDRRGHTGCSLPAGSLRLWREADFRYAAELAGA